MVDVHKSCYLRSAENGQRPQNTLAHQNLELRVHMQVKTSLGAFVRRKKKKKRLRYRMNKAQSWRGNEMMHKKLRGCYERHTYQTESPK